MFENINKFDRVFIILTGNSINFIPQHTWKQLEKECTIIINHVFKIFDKATYLFFSDKDVMYAYYQHFKDKSSRPIAYARDKSLYTTVNEIRYPALVPIEWANKNIDEWWYLKEFIDPNRWRKMNKPEYPKRCNITPCWLFANLIERDYRGKVYLLGADFYIEDDMMHFQNYLLPYYKKRKYENKIKDFIEYFEHPFFQRLNIYNCNPRSNLKKFEFVNLEDILSG